MKKNNKIILIIVALLVVAGTIYYSTTNQTQINTKKQNEEQKEKPFYNESLEGIPYLKNQKLVQNSMEEQGNKNTKGILSYKIEKTDKTIEEVTNYFLEKTDTKIWEVEKLPSSDKNSQQLIYNSKDEKVKSTTQITIIKAEKNMIITLTSYYDNSKLIKESQENNKKAE